MPDPRETLARIREQADNATDGPWIAHRSKRIGTYVTRPDRFPVAREWAMAWEDADAAFIAASRTTVPALLDLADAMLDLADRLDAEDEAMHDFYSWPRDKSEQTKTPASRIRAAVTTALEGLHHA